MRLTGFQLMQLLGVVDHRADATVVIVDSPQLPGVHARLLDDSAMHYVPVDGNEAAQIAQAKADRQVKINQAMAVMRGD